MSEIHSSFSSLTEIEFTTYAETLLESYPTSAERKHAMAYLQMVNSVDSVSLRAEKTSLANRTFDQQRKQRVLEDLLDAHSFDFSKQASLFVPTAVPTNSELAVLLTEDYREIFIKGRQHVGNLVITGNHVKLDGRSNGESAKLETLTNTATVLGTLRIEGDYTIVKGIDFTVPSGVEKAITFASGAKHVTFEDCKFFAGDHVDSKWFYGQYLGGTVTLTNCFVEGFKSWYLADFSSTSGEPEAALTRLKVKNCYFLNNLGSIAARGKTGTPAKLIQYSNNKFETDTLSSSFWDFIEASRDVLKVVITNNEFIGPVGHELVSGKQGCVQVWSRGAHPWTLRYSGNKISNMKIGGKIALQPTFYSPNQSDDTDDQLIDLSATLTNTTFAFSFLYKALDGSTPSAFKWLPEGNGVYQPENLALFPSPPSVVNPNGYSVVTV